MDNNWYVNYRVEVQRRQEEIALAQQERLAKLAAKAVEGGKDSSMFQRWLHGLGVILVNWGYRLQAQSAPVSFITTADGNFLRVKDK